MRTNEEEIDGKTPTNALLFGTPSKLLDGGQTEDQFYSFLKQGMHADVSLGMDNMIEKLLTRCPRRDLQAIDPTSKP